MLFEPFKVLEVLDWDLSWLAIQIFRLLRRLSAFVCGRSGGGRRGKIAHV
jgi:hypothetical protein